MLFAEIPEIDFGSLYFAGDFSEKAKQLNGKLVQIRGYMAPPLKADALFFVLTRMPMSVCPFCDNEVDWPDNIIFIQTKKPFKLVRFNKAIRVEGILSLGTKIDAETGFVSRVRLENAKVL